MIFKTHCLYSGYSKNHWWGILVIIACTLIIVCIIKFQNMANWTDPIYFCLHFTDKRRREETTSDVYSSLYSSSAEDLPTMVTSNHEDSAFQGSSRHRSGSDLTSIKPKPTKQDTQQSATGKSKGDGRSSASQGLMSPFRTFILNEGDSLFDSDPSAWGDISSFDKTSTGKTVPLSKLTSPGTTGGFWCIFIRHVLIIIDLFESISLGCKLIWSLCFLLLVVCRIW